MTTGAIVDTGPLVAFLDRSESHHAWMAEMAGALSIPWLTCEAVLAESAYLLRKVPGGPDGLLGMMADGLLRAPFSLAEEIAPVRALLQRYRDRPISLANACLVRMAERFDDHAVVTFDSDFLIYRKQDRKPIPLIRPGG